MQAHSATSDAGATSPPVRRRPRDRKSQIIKVASRAFSERGYHPVGVDEIAAELGISGPAMYRHFPNKYALLVACAETGAQLLLSSTTQVDGSSAEPADQLRGVIAGLVGATVDNRRGGGLYRWERRYLEPEDRKRLRGIYDAVNAALEKPLRGLRPDLTDADAQLLTNAALSVIGSITAHRVTAPAQRLEAIVAELAWQVLTTELPPPPDPAEPPRVREPGLTVSAKREVLLTEAVKIFSARGYHETSIEEIGAAAGMNASSVYRHFPSKAELLAAAFYRAGDRLAVSIADALAESSDARQAVERLAERYVELAFASPELIAVYFAEFGNLPESERSNLRAIQRQNVAEWVHLLIETGIDPVDARLRVHAALGVVVDIGRLNRFDRRPATVRRVQQLVNAVVFGN
ncbi:TetR/AcrR family transcriptional regulator [Skermania sp. ID1734]|uniref:TetR/AcrR family transcriptional regulator n=1 Tax=Skermania sp. ID1734 TaxID=2597516 RepID=UPI00117ED5F6|nr:TetR/AcrR family transcriptional regulator [Skermania sp. ID1734]TSE02158.1 TetR/AcrR family transcriptional regulator [Skermania sp. ID1734]